MRITYVLPHGWRFAGWSLEDVLRRYHFSKHLAYAESRLGHEVTLLLLHEDVRAPVVVQTEPYRIEVLPVTASIPFLRFGGDFSQPLLRRLSELRADVVHIHGCFYESLPMLVRVPRAPVVVQWHGGRLLPLRNPGLRIAYSHVRRVILPFQAARNLLGRLGSDTSKLAVVPMPLRAEADAASPRASYGRPGTRLLYVGRIARPGGNLWERRLDILLRILGRMRSVAFSLDVVGEGPGEPECRRIALGLGMEGSVAFRGYLTMDRLLQFYRDADLTVAPFYLSDLTGTWVAQLQESLALGVPVAAFAPDGRFSEHEVGWRISADPTAGSSQLTSILANPEGLEKKGRRGTTLVRALCNEDVVARQLESVYRDL